MQEKSQQNPWLGVWSSEHAVQPRLVSVDLRAGSLAQQCQAIQILQGRCLDVTGPRACHQIGCPSRRFAYPRPEDVLHHHHVWSSMTGTLRCNHDSSCNTSINNMQSTRGQCSLDLEVGTAACSRMMQTGLLPRCLTPTWVQAPRFTPGCLFSPVFVATACFANTGRTRCLKRGLITQHIASRRVLYTVQDGTRGVPDAP